MAQYISKSALVTELERRKKKNLLNEGAYEEDIDIISLVNTLEVKEVDLEKELNIWRHNHFHGRRDKEANGEYFERISQLDLAKHFFELGLKLKKGE